MTKLTIKALAMCLGLFATITTTAQNRCGYEELHQYYLQTDPGYAQRLQGIETAVQQYQVQGNSRQRVLITIPVVVHVVHNGEAEGIGRNISEAQILSQLEVLNEDYRFVNVDAALIPGAFQSLATDMEIEFCLAIRDPDGNPTTGIERINGGQATWLMSEVENDLKPISIWDPTKYLNIWTLQLGGANASTLGYSSKPGQNPNVDGVVVQYRNFGRVGNLTAPFDKGRTCTHEVGHFLGLDHVWGLTEPNMGSCGDDDGIADTPIQDKANYGCPTFPKISCSNGPNGDMFMNYMDYVNDACMFMFSAGQKARVNTLINTYRSTLVASTVCTRYTLDAALVQLVHPQVSVCENTFRPVILVRNEGSQTITSLLVNNVVDQSNFIQKQWTGSLASGESVYIQFDPLTLADGAHEFNVYISNPNNGADQFNDNNSVDINFTVANETGIFPLVLSLNEGFEGVNFPPTLWEVTSSGGASGAWELSTEGGFGTSPNGTKVDFFSSNTSNQKQSLITPYFEVPFGQTAALSFSYAYARKDSVTNDSLNLYFSLDCGESWVRFWSKSGIHLQTAPTQNIAFVPTSTEWERVGGFNLKAVQGQNRVRIKFEAVSNNGNNIYLDDINLDYWTVGVPEQQPLAALKLYPNPASKQITLQLDGINGEANIVAYDLQGKLLINNQVSLNNNVVSLDVAGLNAGMYLVKVSTQAGERVVKLVVE